MNSPLPAIFWRDTARTRSRWFWSSGAGYFCRSNLVGDQSFAREIPHHHNSRHTRSEVTSRTGERKYFNCSWNSGLIRERNSGWPTRQGHCLYRVIARRNQHLVFGIYCRHIRHCCTFGATTVNYLSIKRLTIPAPKITTIKRTTASVVAGRISLP